MTRPLCCGLYRFVDWIDRSSLIPAWLRPFLVTWLRQTAWLLDFEPSWFGEFGLALGALGWGLASLVTDDFTVEGRAYILPVLAIVGGLARGFILMRLWYEARVILASASALLWGWLWWALAGRWGVVPMMGPLFGIFVIELLTAAKFSLPCVRELRDDFLAWRAAR